MEVERSVVGDEEGLREVIEEFEDVGRRSCALAPRR